MVDKGNVDKHRHSMSGLKVQETEKWGADKARERYGDIRSPDMKPKDQSAPQKLGDPNNLQDKGYANNHREDWVRGFGKGGVESAETKPGFDHGGKRR